MKVFLLCFVQIFAITYCVIEIRIIIYPWITFLVIYNIFYVQARVKSINICYTIQKEMRCLLPENIDINKFNMEIDWSYIICIIILFQAHHHSIHIKVVKFMVKILPIWFSTMWSYCLSSYFRWFMIHVFSLYDVHAFGI